MAHPILFDGPAGQLEGLISQPELPHPSVFAVICHPHPLHEGTMHNKVVTILAKVFSTFNCPVLRFNYRGVGKSAGEYDEGRGESEDAQAAVAYLQTRYPQATPWLAGFSFGSYVAANTAMQCQAGGLISIAPPIERMPFDDLTITCPWWVIQGETDEVVNPTATHHWAANKAIHYHSFPDTCHFFHGKLTDLQQLLNTELNPYLGETA